MVILECDICGRKKRFKKIIIRSIENAKPTTTVYLCKECEKAFIDAYIETLEKRLTEKYGRPMKVIRRYE